MALARAHTRESHSVVYQRNCDKENYESTSNITRGEVFNANNAGAKREEISAESSKTQEANMMGIAFLGILKLY